MNVYENSYLPTVLHDIAQGLLIPAMVLIIIMLILVVFFIGRTIVEYFTERRHYRQNMPAIVNAINDASYQDLTDVVTASQLLKTHKAALVVVTENMGLGEEELFALAQIEINATERKYQHRLAWTDTISKVAPLLGLMGTLIPLGPGIVSLGQGDVAALSNSLLLAFDATVCGLACAIVSLVISKLRSGWYSEYVDSMESLISCIIDRAGEARKQGVALPANYCGDPLKEFEELKKNQAKKNKPAKRAKQNKEGE